MASLSLEGHARRVCGRLGIPVPPPSAENGEGRCVYFFPFRRAEYARLAPVSFLLVSLSSHARTFQRRSLIESLHLLFSLYLELRDKSMGEEGGAIA